MLWENLEEMSMKTDKYWSVDYQEALQVSF